MNIVDILSEKQKTIIDSDSVSSVTFTVDEIYILSNITYLRYLKLKQSFPKDFENSDNVYSCYDKIKGGDTIYRVLEFCLLKNRVLMPCITQVFSSLRRIS